MTITVVTPEAPARLGGTDAPLRFSSTRQLDGLSIGLGVSHEERAYRNGTFLPGYTLSAVDASLNWTIIRDGGWPTDPDLWVDEQQASGIIGGDLSPYLSPTAWYVLDPIRRTVDQSGNGHTLTGSATETAGPSLGLVAGTLIGLTEASPSATWRESGALSVMALVNISSSAGDRWFASCEDNSGFDTWWKFGLSSNGKAFYGVNNGVGSLNVEWGPVLPTSGWHTFVFTRAADGVTLKAYLDGVLQGTATSTMAPAGGAGAVLTVGKDLFSPVQAYNQQCTALWTGVELTADDALALAQRVQGV